MQTTLDATLPPTISVVMPVHNVASYVAESIASLQGQTWKDWELVVINDGSTDGTEPIVQALATQDARIRLVNQVNAGVACARNHGLDLIRGDHLVFLDGDDLWRPDFLAKALAAMRETDADLVFCGLDYLRTDGSRQPRPMRVQPGPVGADELIRLQLAGAVLLAMGNTLLRLTSGIRALRFVEGCRHGEDTEYLLRALSCLDSAYFLEDPLFLYRVRPGSATRQRWDWRSRVDGIHAMERALDHLLRHGSGRYRQAIEGECDKLHFSKYRFLYQMVKSGARNDARAFLAQESWQKSLQFMAQQGSLGHRRKARMLLGQNAWTWRLISLYARLKELSSPSSSSRD